MSDMILTVSGEPDRIVTSGGKIVTIGIPDPPPPLIPDDRHVRWCVYEDGTLVINGENQPNYANHGEVLGSNDTATYYPAQHQWSEQIGLLDLDKSYQLFDGFITGKSYVPWQSAKPYISKVEFAEYTAPTSMSAWFQNCQYLVEIDPYDNLDTSNCTNMTALFMHIDPNQNPFDESVYKIYSVPLFNKISFRNATDLSLAFAGMRLSESYPLLCFAFDGAPPAGCECTGMLTMNPTLSRIFCYPSSWPDEPISGMITGSPNINGYQEWVDGDIQTVNELMNFQIDPSLFQSRGDPGYSDMEVWEMFVVGFSSTPGLFPDGWASYYPVNFLMQCIDSYIVMCPSFQQVMRETQDEWISPNMDNVRDAFSGILEGDSIGVNYDEMWDRISKDPSGAQSEIESLFSAINEVCADSFNETEFHLELNLINVERTEYLTYIEFTLNGRHVRTSLRVPPVLP